MKCIIEYLETSVKNNANGIAVIEEEKRIDYRSLYYQVQVVSSTLIDKVEQRNPVIVYMDKGIDALISFLGIAYVGSFYTLLNPEFPDMRKKNISDTLCSKVIITNEEYYSSAKELFPEKEIYLISELLHGSIQHEKIEKRKNEIIDLDPLYVNFTSGSTGVPKGVVVSHRSVIDFINVFVEKMEISSSAILANQAPFDFDVSVKDIYSSLCVGATLLIVPRKLFSNPVGLLDYLCENKATTLIWAVSALCLISTFHGLDYRIPKSVRKVIFSGEVMPLKHLKNWQEHLPDATFINVYGPTEITCNCTYHIIDANRDYSDGIPIGTSFSNERVFLFNEQNQLIKEKNEVGEICVTGTCLALGYYGNREETAIHFVQNPLNSFFPEVMYRTGDLGCYNELGELLFKGRKDFQIKYQGHRIELEEIEKNINQIDGVERSCCLFDEEKSRLYSYYVGDLASDVIRKMLKKIMPSYMIPSHIIKIDSFPLTKNGKIDRKQLLERKNKND